MNRVSLEQFHQKSMGIYNASFLELALGGSKPQSLKGVLAHGSNGGDEAYSPNSANLTGNHHTLPEVCDEIVSMTKCVI